MKTNLLPFSSPQISHLFDNQFTVAFSVFMSIWARLFLEFWKREQSARAFEWDTLGFEEQVRSRGGEINQF